MPPPPVKSFIEAMTKTPLIYLVHTRPGATLCGKFEASNPLGSIKDRVAVAMIRDAEKREILREGMTIVEPTSGNTGIALAGIAALRGYKLILTMPETMSAERQKLLTSLGAELVLTPGEEGMGGAIRRANEIVAEKGGDAFMPNQFENLANPRIHFETTGPEIWKTMKSGGGVDALIAGVGTGGTISGVGRYLQTKNPEVQIIAVEPQESPVISQHLAGEPLNPGAHRISGIGAGFIPKLLDTSILTRVIRVSSEDAFSSMRELIRTKGLLVGPSSGAAVHAAMQLAVEGAGKRIVAILPDGAERYLSML